jgi:hypothetical protein
MNLLPALGLTAVAIAILSRKTGTDDTTTATDTATGYRSFLGNWAYPRGIRNNNPGNLVITNIGWKQKLPVNQNTDGTFEQFTYLPYGIRAMMIDLSSDIADGQNTLKKIIYGTTPYNAYSQTDQAAYVANVSSWTGYSPTQLLNTDATTIKKLVDAFSRMENGNYLTSTDINQAWSLV